MGRSSESGVLLRRLERRANSAPTSAAITNLQLNQEQNAPACLSTGTRLSTATTAPPCCAAPGAAVPPGSRPGPRRVPPTACVSPVGPPSPRFVLP